MYQRTVLCAVAMLAGGSSACSLATISNGEVGVVWTTDGVKAEPLQEGRWVIGFFDRTTSYDARSQEKNEELEVLASNGLRILLDTSVRYRIIKEDVVKLDRELGPDYYATLLGPTVRSQARRVVGRYQPEEIYSTQRELIEREIRQGVDTAIKDRHIQLEAVLIRNVKLPEPIQAAINSKLEAEQAALKMKYIIAQTEAEAKRKMIETQAETERSKVQAQARSETDKIGAESRATAKKIDAQATDEYERVVNQHITEQILRLEQIDALKALGQSPNSKVVFLGASGAKAPLLLDVK
jgi:regulator of protease activity HflC (stomatin/prohibitin superfamily)